VHRNRRPAHPIAVIRGACPEVGCELDIGGTVCAFAQGEAFIRAAYAPHSACHRCGTGCLEESYLQHWLAELSMVDVDIDSRRQIITFLLCCVRSVSTYSPDDRQEKKP